MYNNKCHGYMNPNTYSPAQPAARYVSRSAHAGCDVDVPPPKQCIEVVSVDEPSMPSAGRHYTTKVVMLCRESELCFILIRTVRLGCQAGEQKKSNRFHSSKLEAKESLEVENYYPT